MRYLFRRRISFHGYQAARKGSKSMNQIIQSLMTRKSVRSFTDQEIPEEIIQVILEASTQAPTAGNQQLYTILRITDPEKNHRLSISCDHQPFIEKANLVLVYCADCLKWYTAFKESGCDPRDPGEGDLLLAVCDAVIAAQNAVVAAESFGIGSCYIGDIMENIEEQRDTRSASLCVPCSNARLRISHRAAAPPQKAGTGRYEVHRP